MGHCADCAEVNGWTDAQKLSFLKVRLTGHAQGVFHRLSDTDKASYVAATAAVTAHFEPKEKRELYLANFSTRNKKPSETWIEYGEELL